MATFIAGVTPPPAELIRGEPQCVAPRRMRSATELSVGTRNEPLSRDRQNAPGVREEREANPVNLAPCLTVLDGRASAIFGVPA